MALLLQQLNEICRASSVLVTPHTVVLVKMPLQLYRGPLGEPVLAQGGLSTFLPFPLEHGSGAEQPGLLVTEHSCSLPCFCGMLAL